MEIPERAGVMVVRECVLFPRSLMPLFIFEPRYRTMLSEALETDRMFCLAVPKPGSTRGSPCEVAGLGLVRASVLNSDGTSNLVLQGLMRVRLGKAVRYKPYRQHLIEPLEDDVEESLVVDALVARVLDLTEALLRIGTKIPLALLRQLAGGGETEGPVTVKDCVEPLRQMTDPGAMADMVATMLLPDGAKRQVILQAVEVEERLKHLVRLLSTEVTRAKKA